MHIWQSSQTTQSCGVLRGNIWPFLSLCHLRRRRVTRLLQSCPTSSTRQVGETGREDGATGCALAAAVTWGKHMPRQGYSWPRKPFSWHTGWATTDSGMLLSLRVLQKQQGNSLSLALQEPRLSRTLQV